MAEDTGAVAPLGGGEGVERVPLGHTRDAETNAYSETLWRRLGIDAGVLSDRGDAVDKAYSSTVLSNLGTDAGVLGKPVPPAAVTHDCGNCRYWNQSEGSYRYGYCRRRAPAALVMFVTKEGVEELEVNVSHPVTQNVEWCGEHELRQGAA